MNIARLEGNVPPLEIELVLSVVQAVEKCEKLLTSRLLERQRWVVQYMYEKILFEAVC